MGVWHLAWLVLGSKLHQLGKSGDLAQVCPQRNGTPDNISMFVPSAALFQLLYPVHPITSSRIYNPYWN